MEAFTTRNPQDIVSVISAVLDKHCPDRHAVAPKSLAQRAAEMADWAADMKANRDRMGREAQARRAALSPAPVVQQEAA